MTHLSSLRGCRFFLEKEITVLFNTETKSLKGGTVLYVNKDLDYFERVDLNVQNDLVEAVWIEIKNSNSKNIVCGCVYRHPRLLKKDYDDFNKFMDSTLDKLVKEKKEIYICGDFKGVGGV